MSSKKQFTTKLRDDPNVRITNKNFEVIVITSLKVLIEKYMSEREI